jgi:putative transposase
MAAEVRFKKELLDELLAGHDAKAVFERDGLLDDLKKALAERILNAEMDHHLGQESEQAAGMRSMRGSHRTNGQRGSREQ